MTDTELHALESRIILAIREQTHESIKTTGSKWVAEASSAAVEATFIKLGLDCKDPIEAQKDFAHLRQSRKESEDRKKLVIQTIAKHLTTLCISAIVAGAATWIAITSKQ